MSPPRGAVIRTLRITTLFASTRMSPTRSRFSITAPFWFTVISPFLGTRWEPGLTPVLPAPGQPEIGGLAAGAGAGDAVFAFDGVFDADGVADFAGVAGVDAGVDADVDVASGIEAEVD